MRNIFRGFTIVELMVVVTILAIMTGGITLAYIAGQKQASAGQAQSIARTVVAAAERYYKTHSEYPSSTTIAGATKDLTDNEIAAAATVFGVKPDSLKGPNANDFRLSPCNQTANTNCPLSNVLDTQAYVYYVTRANTGGNGTINSNLYGGCVVTIPSALGSTAFFVAYFDPSDKEWVLYRSANGDVTVSGGCSFS